MNYKNPAFIASLCVAVISFMQPFLMPVSLALLAVFVFEQWFRERDVKKTAGHEKRILELEDSVRRLRNAVGTHKL